LIFGSAQPQEVALAFLGSDGHDAEVEKKGASRDLVLLLRDAFEADLPEDAALPDVRERLGRHVLLTDFVAELGEAVPSPLASVRIASSPAAVEGCVHLARTWRLRRDVRDRYVAVAGKIEQEFAVHALELDPAQIAEVETFRAVERALLRHFEEALLETPRPELLALAQSRLARFWAEVIPSVQAHWALIASAAAILLEADRVAQALKKAPITVPDLVQAYAEGEQPWCLLDAHHRHMESRWSNFEPEHGEDDRRLEKLVVRARQRYTEVGSDLARHFVAQYQKTKHPLQGVLQQREVFETQVRPKLDKGKVAYVWVDALRFEMARALSRLLRDDFDLTIRPALGTVPTITEIGMAALLPHAHQSAKVVAAGGGKLALEIDGTTIRDRKDRIAFLKEHAGVPVFDAKLDELLPKPSKRVRDGIKEARLVLVTSQEIDELCEADNIVQARRQMDGVLHDLRRGVRVLADLGLGVIVLTADHGHLFADEISEDMKINASGGVTADLHRRVWVGVGGTLEPSYLRAPLISPGVDRTWTSPPPGRSPASAPRAARGPTSTVDCRPRS
jgi:hypothetical protein